MLSGQVTFTRKEVESHHSTHSLWVLWHNKVFDVTFFGDDHPGGLEILLQYGGKDITQVMSSPDEHQHSEAAFDMLQEYYIGDLDPNDIDSKSASTTTVKQTSKLPFIDPHKPMIAQILKGSFSKKFYMEQIHIARHVNFSAPMFESPLLEPFTKTNWFVIPLFWTPFIYYAFQKSLLDISVSYAWPCFLFGILLFTLIEYSLHRFLFHIDRLLPDHPYALVIHFTMHGVHHYLPMDRYRLVLPPALGMALVYPIWSLIVALLPSGVGQAVVSGALLGLVLYDLSHYYFHHAKPSLKYFKDLKTYHLDHHYKEANMGFGVSSTLWDHVFGTLLIQ